MASSKEICATPWTARRAREGKFTCQEAGGDRGDSMGCSRYFSPITNPRIMTKRNAMSVGTVTGKK